MDSESKKQLAVTATEFSMTFCLPILIVIHENSKPIFNNATMTLLNLSNKIIGITCAHVVDQFNLLISENKKPIFEIGAISIDPNKHLIAHNSVLDLASFSFTEREYRQMIRVKSGYWLLG